MQYKRIFIPFEIDIEDNFESGCDEFFTQEVNVIETTKTKIVDEEIEKKLNEGWEIKSTTARTTTYSATDSSNPDNIFTKQLTYTQGIDVFLVKE